MYGSRKKEIIITKTTRLSVTVTVGVVEVGVVDTRYDVSQLSSRR